MSTLQLYKQALDNALRAVELKASFERSDLRKAVVQEIHVKQFEETEDELAAALQPMFVRQVESIATELAKLDVPEDKKNLAPISDEAQNLINQSFDPSEWKDELIERALPVIAKKMFEAAHAQLRVMGFDRKSVVAWRDKHLAGSHNQQTHGSGGRGGKRVSKEEARNAIEDYSTDHFQRVNEGLRSGDVDSKDPIVRGVDSYLKNQPKRKGDTIRSFGTDSDRYDEVKGMLESGTFTDAAYISTAKKPSLTDRIAFTQKIAPKGHVVLKITGKNGVDISDVSLNPTEGEVLYPRGTKFKVVKFVELETGSLLAELEES